MYLSISGHQTESRTTFGWMLGTNRATLWQGTGQVSGYQPDIFRCQSVALVSALTFLREICRYHNIRQYKGTVYIITDNTHLIRRWQHLNSFPATEWWPKVWTWPNIDATHEAIQIQQQLPHMLQISMQTPQSTAPDRSPLHRWLQRLLDKAHIEATAAAIELLPQPSIPMPHCKIYIEHKSELLIAKELNYCRQILPAERILDYYRKRHEWAKPTCDSIHWQAFQSARSSTPHLHSFVSKLVAKALPTNKKLAQREGIPSKCPFCQIAESNPHLWLCHSRQGWRKTFLTRLTNQLAQSGTNTYIREHIVSQTQQYLQGAPARTTENPIGWDSMFLGFIPVEWSTDNSVAPKLWGKQLIIFLWQEVYNLWKSRNDKVHQRTESHRSLQEELRAQTAIKAFYRYELEVGPHDRNLFSIPWQERINIMTPKEVLSWIRTMTPAILKARTQYITRSTLGTRDIRSYFTRPAAS